MKTDREAFNRRHMVIENLTEEEQTGMQMSTGDSVTRYKEIVYKTVKAKSGEMVEIPAHYKMYSEEEIDAEIARLQGLKAEMSQLNS
jgi:hypothetical protein